MKSVLDQLVREARQRAARLRTGQLGADGQPLRRQGASFLDAIAGKERLSVIAEFKRSSPSQGPIAARAKLEEQVVLYENAGAAAISVLTEPKRFGGSSEDLRRASRAVSVPLLMKDFVVATSQVRLAAELGASAVLLIVRCLQDVDLNELLSECVRCDLDPLVECHDEDDLERALDTNAPILGINNRNLSTLEIDRSRAPELLRRIPDNRVAIAESGYDSLDQLTELRGLADAVLVGTRLMSQGDPGGFIREASR